MQRERTAYTVITICKRMIDARSCSGRFYLQEDSMQSPNKYQAFPRIELPDRTWPSNAITAPPIWCSVDLRDGNQSLVTPMDIEQKIMFFEMLIAIGFKQIEIGFPSASKADFDFCRRLIEESRIPDDVAVQVLTQARKHLIERTAQAVRGAPRAIIHVYNSTSPAQRELVFRASEAEVARIAVEGVKLVRSLRAQSSTPIMLEYSPESFSQTELPFARDICDAVIDAWAPDPDEKVIINLPATVEAATPNIHADQIEWFIRNLRNRSQAEISIHTHNDRGTAVAAAEFAQMAGARRVEGTLFGNGERTGNADLVTLALNLYSQGIDPNLDLADLPAIADVYTQCTGMTIPVRHPYAGELVFTAFSGSHQDAISKGLADYRNSKGQWRVPYLPLDPRDIGRNYEAIIRINSQSGKGGAAYVLESRFGYRLPKAMHPEFGAVVQNETDRSGRELPPEELFACFAREYLHRTAPLALQNLHIDEYLQNQAPKRRVAIEVDLIREGRPMHIKGIGNGVIDAFAHALRGTGFDFEILSYDEHSLEEGSDAKAVAYIQIAGSGGKPAFGVGVDTDITVASAHALVCAVNRAMPATPAASAACAAPGAHF